MKILVNTTYYSRNRFGGVSRYIKEVALRINTFNDAHLSQFEFCEVKNDLEIDAVKSPCRISGKLAKVVLLLAPNISSKFFKIDQSDILWLPVPTTLSPKLKKGKVLVTIHDIAPLMYPQYFPFFKRLLWLLYLMRAVQLSDYIIVPSEVTKMLIISKLGYPERNIKVIYHGINYRCDFSRASEFVVTFVGELCYKKGADILLKAMSKLFGLVDFKLFIVSNKNTLSKKHTKLLEYLVKKKIIFMFSNISDEELLDVYKRSTILVAPSRVEGFGIPILEAMATYTYVVCSDIPVFREIGGNYPFFTNDADGIVSQVLAIHKLGFTLTPSLQAAAEYSKSFSWERSSNEHFVLFQNVLNNV